jgi:hypothetical protein
MRFVAALLVLLVASSGHAEQPKEPTPVARERAEALKADLPRLQVWLRYHGEQDKPYYNLTLTTAEVRDGAPFHLRARLTDAQAIKLIDHLALEGFLDEASDESKKDVVPPKGPLYALKVIGGDKEWTEYIRFEMGMLTRFDDLRKHMDGEPARCLDVLLGRLSGHRREWEKAGK